MPASVYLDYNATAPVRPPVIEAMAQALAETGNPSSVHRAGRLARRKVEIAREKVAAFVGAEPNQVVFLSGGSEANNLALAAARGGPVLVSAVEHESVLKAAPGAVRIPVAANGALDLERLSLMLEHGPAPALVSVMLANNETGAIQPVAEVARLAHARGALVHCDAVQASGKVAVDIPTMGVDFLTLSAHKFGGPQGVGALVARSGIDLDKTLIARVLGGGQERGRRAGTENVPAIVGFGIAVEEAARDLLNFRHVESLRDSLEARVKAISPGTTIFASGTERLPNTSCFATPGLAGEVQVMALDLAGVAVSSGSACSSGKVTPSHVLKAMGVDACRASAAIRISLGWASRPEDVDKFIEAWGALVARASQQSPRKEAANAA